MNFLKGWAIFKPIGELDSLTTGLKGENDMNFVIAILYFTFYFRNLNMLAFVKILKKFDKVFTLFKIIMMK